MKADPYTEAGLATVLRALHKQYPETADHLRATFADRDRQIRDKDEEIERLRDLLVEALPYVEEVEQFHKPGRAKLGTELRKVIEKDAEGGNEKEARNGY